LNVSTAIFFFAETVSVAVFVRLRVTVSATVKV
jgi:hypothetical protein